MKGERKKKNSEENPFCLLFSKDEVKNDLQHLISSMKSQSTTDRAKDETSRVNLSVSENENNSVFLLDEEMELENRSVTSVPIAKDAPSSGPTSAAGTGISSIFGASKTPFKVRDNISYFIGGGRAEGAPVSPPSPVGHFSKVGETSMDNSFSYNELNDFPLSRTAIVNPFQKAAFLNQLDKLKYQKHEYYFYFKWVLWTQIQSESDIKSQRKIQPEKVIETNIDFKVTAKIIKRIFNQQGDGNLIVMKLGLIPSKLSPNLLNGCTIRFKVIEELSYDMFKQILILVLNDSLNLPNELDLLVCGVSHRFLPNSNYSIISIWLPENPYPTSKVLTFSEKLKNLLPDQYGSIIQTGVLCENNTLNVVPVYQEEEL